MGSSLYFGGDIGKRRATKVRFREHSICRNDIDIFKPSTIFVFAAASLHTCLFSTDPTTSSLPAERCGRSPPPFSSSLPALSSPLRVPSPHPSSMSPQFTPPSPQDSSQFKPRSPLPAPVCLFSSKNGAYSHLILSTQLPH